MNSEIQKANIKDISVIVAIHKQCINQINAKFYNPQVIQEWQKQVNEKNVRTQFYSSIWFLITIDKGIIGFCQFEKDKGEIYQINIKPEFQGQGLGKKLLGFIENYYKTRGLKKIELNATLSAQGFYRASGYEVEENFLFQLRSQKIKMARMFKSFA